MSAPASGHGAIARAGRTGLREAHAHVAALGESLEIPSLAACGSVAECLDRVRREAEVPRAGGWLRFMGARMEGWDERRWPTIDELDAAAGSAPCVIKSFDHHAAVANRAALHAAGLKAGAAVPPNGVVCADERGEATGLLIEQAASAAWHAAPEPTLAERRGHVEAALAHLASLGYVEVHDLLSQEWLGPILAGLEREGRLALDVWLYPALEHARRLAAGRHGWESSRIKLAGAKIFADGTLNSRTAHVLAPYEGMEEAARFGHAMLDGGQLDGAMRTTGEMGIGLAVHAIGDGAVRAVLDAWERCAAGGGADRAKPRSVARGVPALRIEHAELIDAADVGRFARMGVVCSVQPCHLLVDVEVLTRALPHRLDRVFPLRELIDSGCRPGELLWFGSDVPIVPAAPMDSVVAATMRRRIGMPESRAIGWGQRISEAEAWGAFGRR